MTFAKVPERVEGALRGAFGANDKNASLRKSDRLPPPGGATAARNVVRGSTVTRVGNRDVMRVRPFIRISGNLSMTTSDLSAKIPPFNAQRMLSDVGAAVPAASDPYAGLETRVVRKSVTLLPKTKDQATGGNPSNERVHIVKKGDTVTSILRDQGATPEEAKSIAATLGARGRDGGLKEGQKLRILMAPAGPGQRLQPYRVIVANESTVEAVAALADLGKYVAVDVQSMNTVADAADSSDDDDDDDGNGVRLYQSIYETALRNKVPASVIEDMVRIYSYDVDFQRKVQPGDSFYVFFAGEDEGA